MSWNIGDKRNLFLKVGSKMRLYHVVLTTPKTSAEKPALTVVKLQQLPDIKKTDSKEEIFRLKWTLKNGRRKVCIFFQTDTDKLNIVVYRYRNSLYLKDNEVDLQMTEYQSLLAKRVYLLSYTDIFYKRCIVLDETTDHNYHKLRQEWKIFSTWAFSDCTRVWKCHLKTIVFAKTYFWVHVSVGILDFLHVRWTKNWNLVEPLVMGTRTGSFYFVISKSLDYTQSYMMLLEQCGPGFCYMIGRGPSSCLLGHPNRLLFCLYVKIILPPIFESADFWNSMSLIVLDTELTEKDIIKELAVYIDCSLQGVSFCPPKTFKPNKQTTWNTKHLHGIAWSSGKLDYDKFFAVF